MKSSTIISGLFLFIIISAGDTSGGNKIWLESIHRIENIAHPTKLEQEHIPRIKLPAGIRKDEVFFVRIRISDYIHPMTEKHHIMYLEWYLDGVLNGRIEFTPAMPRAEVEIPMKLQKEGELRVLARCNKHGLWENTVRIHPIQ